MDYINEDLDDETINDIKEAASGLCEEIRLKSQQLIHALGKERGQAFVDQLQGVNCVPLAAGHMPGYWIIGFPKNLQYVTIPSAIIQGIAVHVIVHESSTAELLTLAEYLVDLAKDRMGESWDDQTLH